MNTNDYIELFDELDDFEQVDNYINKSQRRQKHPLRHPDKLPAADKKFVSRQDDSLHAFKFTYKASRHEEGWLLDSLGAFYEQQWISDVLRMIKGGKEASVYMCKPGAGLDAEFLAVKVYRPRQFRNLKNDALYRVGRTELDEDGRAIVDDKTLHAIRDRSAFGEKTRHQSWIAFEFQALQSLYTAGVDVPIVYAMGNNAIVMEYIGDSAVAAPTLNTVKLMSAEARVLFERVLGNVDRMLTHGCIHADLSAYNILYWDGEITLIDFPQVVSPDGNPSAWQIFLRDMTRVCQYFALQGVRAEPRKLAAELWKAHGHRLVREVHPAHLNADDPNDRKVWEQQR